MNIKQKIYNVAAFLFIWGLLPLILDYSFISAQEPLPAANKSEILRYREQQDILSNDLQGLGYSESAQIIKEETSSRESLINYYKQGKSYFKEGQYEKALVEFKNALDWNPEYKPALKYVDLIEEEMRRQQQLKEKKESAEKKIKEEEEKRQEKEFFRLSRIEKAKYEQDVKSELEQNRNFKKLNEAKVKDVLNVKLKHYKSDRKIQEELLREQKKIQAKNAKSEKIALLKAEKAQSEKFRRQKLAKEKELQAKNLEQNKKLAEEQRQMDLAGHMAAEEVLPLEPAKAKQEQIIRLELEKSRNLKKLNETRFKEELIQKPKAQDLIPVRESPVLSPQMNADLSKGIQAEAAPPKQSREELPQSQNIPEVKGPETAIAQSTAVSPVQEKQTTSGNEANYKESIPSPDSPESPKIQQGVEDKYTKLFKESEAIKKDYNNLLVQVKELLADSDRARELEALLEKNNSVLESYKKDNERVKKDYSNLLLQVKMLLVYRQRIKQLEGLLEDNKISAGSLGKEKEVAVLEKNELKRKNEELQQLQPQILKERDVYKDAYEKLKDTYEKLYSEAVTNKLKVKQFMDDTPVLERKNKEMESELKRLRAEKRKIENDYNDALTRLKRSIPETRRVKEIENLLAKNKAGLNSLMKEKAALKEERSRILSQMKGLLGDRRQRKELEHLLEENNAEIKSMKKENDALRKDYNSLLVQVKASIIDKRRLEDIEGALDKKKTDMNLLIKDSETIKTENVKLQNKVKQFEDELAKLSQDRDKYKTAYENDRNDTAVKKLKDGMSDLEKEKSGLSSQLKQAQRENETIKKDYEGLLGQVKELLIDKNRLKELEGAVEKNKADKSSLEKDNKSVKSENLELQNKIKELESLRLEASKARDEYKAAHKEETGDTEGKALKQIQKENDLIKKDYAALLAQMKDLLADSRRVKDMEILLEKNKANMILLEKEKEAAKAENAVLKNKARKLEESQRKSAMARQDTGVQKGSNKEAADKKLKIKKFRTEDREMNEFVLSEPEAKSQAQSEDSNSKFEAENERLNNELEEYKKKYSQELEKNKSVTREKNNLPRKFDDVVKKNEVLTKETADMHYNLGVFFIKNNEYDRALVEFEKAIEISPEDPYSYYNLGYIYAQYLNDRKKAVKYFRKFLQFVKNDDKDIEWVKDYLLTWEAYK